MNVEPALHQPALPDTRGVLTWIWPQPVRALTSAAVGGGLIETRSLLNIGVTSEYRRVDLEAHAVEAHASLGLDALGPTLYTAADVRRVVAANDGDVRCDATVGVTKPTWAADVDDAYSAWSPGTVNIVVQLPVAFTDAALVNAVMTATEAKTQAFIEAGVPGTGTASDAVAIVLTTVTGPRADFAGPRSTWGSRIARTVHEAIQVGIAGQP